MSCSSAISDRVVRHIFENYTDDDVITHEAIEMVIGANRDNMRPKYQTIMKNVKQHLMKTYRIFVVPVSGVGYKILSPFDSVQMVEGEVIQNRNNMIKSVEKLRYVRYDEIKKKDKVDITEAIGRMNAIVSMVSRPSIRSSNNNWPPSIANPFDSIVGGQ